MTQFTVLKSFQEVQSYVSSVQQAADSNRNSFGFLPSRAYEQLAFQEKLWIVIQNGKLAGYLAFGGAFPHLSVLQVYVAEEFRGAGLGRRLIEELIAHGEATNHLSIRANVAHELEANRFWDAAGFEIIRTKPGGAARNRTINVRVRQLNTPTLFSSALPGSTSEPIEWTFGGRPINRGYSYVLDLNVILDAIRDRQNAAAARAVIQASMNNLIALRVTPELQTELTRVSGGVSPDPLVQLVRSIPVLPHVPEQELMRLRRELRSIVFPGRDLERRGGVQDESDLAHLAYCAHHQVTGFITGERALLRARSAILSRYHVDVIAPADLNTEFDSSQDINASIRLEGVHEEIAIRDFAERDRGAINAFLKSRGYDKAACAALWDAGATGATRLRKCVWVGAELLGVASWNRPTGLHPHSTVFIEVDLTQPSAALAVDHLLELSHRAFAGLKVGTVDLVIRGDLNVAQTLARRRGYRSVVGTLAIQGTRTLRKVLILGYVHEGNWAQIRAHLRQRTDLTLPVVMPESRQGRPPQFTVTAPDGRASLVPLSELETVMGPVLFLFQSRSCVLVPIRRGFSAELLGSPQLSLLPHKGALVRTEKAYYRAPTGANRFRAGMPIVFYESGDDGRRAAIGCARLTYSAVLPAYEVAERFEPQGVLSASDIDVRSKEGSVHVFTFDNFQEFVHPVSYLRLKRLGCIGKANLVTAEVLSGESVLQLFREGFGHDSH